MEVSSATRSRIMEALVAKSDEDQLSSIACHVIKQHELLNGTQSAGEDVVAAYFSTLVTLLESKDVSLDLMKAQALS